MDTHPMILFGPNNPKWVETDRVTEHDNGTATVVAWGYQFVGCEIKHSPSDRFEAERKFALVKHPTGNWLNVYW